MKSLIISTLLLLSLSAETNSTQKSDQNSTNRASKELKKQIQREAKFAKEQRFYQAEEYDLSYAEVDPDSLDSIPLIEPDYEFDMDDVYD